MLKANSLMHKNNSAPELPLADGLGPRAVALDLLQQVLGAKRPLDQVLDLDAAFHRLDARDRSFVRMMVATTLRRKGQIDDLIARALDKGQEPRPETLRHILYIGITQILFMDVPDHAAVDTSVSLAAHYGMEKQKGFVNAVLRRMISEGREWAKKQDDVRLNFPDWVLRAWIDDYELSKALEIATASLAEAPLDITVKKREEEKLWESTLESSRLPTGTLRRTGGGNVADFPGLADGSWWVQDASSALPVRLMGDIAGKKVIDLCAAPGGKTMQLAAAGARVTAVDRSATRLKILNENVTRTGLASSVATVIADGAEWKPQEKADIILVDAPCTATGTIRRHPDLLHLKNERDLHQLVNVQARLLDNAASMAAGKGSFIFYCTCSLQKDEGERQVDRFVHDHPEFKRTPFKAAEVFGLDAAITDYGDLRILPFHLAPHGGMDGFFIARLEKI